MKLRELTETYLKHIGGLSSLEEVTNYTNSKMSELAKKLNKRGHDINISLDIIANKPRIVRGNDDINNYHFLLDLERISHRLKDEWISAINDEEYAQELQERVEQILFRINTAPPKR